MKIWSSHLLDNLSNCLMNLKNSGDSTGFKPMTSAMPVQCSNQLSYEVTQLRAGQFVGLMFFRERNVVWKMYYMKCGVWNQMKIWSSHLLANLSNGLMNLKNSGDSTGFEPMTHDPLNCPVSARIISSILSFSSLIAIRTKTNCVSDEEVSAKVRNWSLFSLNVLTRDVSIPVRYSLRTVTP